MYEEDKQAEFSGDGLDYSVFRRGGNQPDFSRLLEGLLGRGDGLFEMLHRAGPGGNVDMERGDDEGDGDDEGEDNEEQVLEFSLGPDVDFDDDDDHRHHLRYHARVRAPDGQALTLNVPTLDFAEEQQQDESSDDENGPEDVD